MRTFEYHTSFVPIAYQEAQGFFSNPPQTPDVDSLFGDHDHQEYLRDMGAKGWELISVQSVLKGVIAGVASYPVTAGYFLFWKRETTEVQ